MSKNSSLLSDVEKQTAVLVKAYKELKQENSLLENELKSMQERLAMCKANVRELEEINQQMKVANAMLGNSEHRRLMKLKINKLIREVDACIGEVKKQKN